MSPIIILNAFHSLQVALILEIFSLLPQASAYSCPGLMDFYNSVIECADQMGGVSSQSALCRWDRFKCGVPCMIPMPSNTLERISVVLMYHNLMAETHPC